MRITKQRTTRRSEPSSPKIRSRITKGRTIPVRQIKKVPKKLSKSKAKPMKRVVKDLIAETILNVSKREGVITFPESKENENKTKVTGSVVIKGKRNLKTNVKVTKENVKIIKRNQKSIKIDKIAEQKDNIEKKSEPENPEKVLKSGKVIPRDKSLEKNEKSESASKFTKQKSEKSEKIAKPPKVVSKSVKIEKGCVNPDKEVNSQTNAVEKADNANKIDKLRNKKTPVVDNKAVEIDALQDKKPPQIESEIKSKPRTVKSPVRKLDKSVDKTQKNEVARCEDSTVKKDASIIEKKTVSNEEDSNKELKNDKSENKELNKKAKPAAKKQVANIDIKAVKESNVIQKIRKAAIIPRSLRLQMHKRIMNRNKFNNIQAKRNLRGSNLVNRNSTKIKSNSNIKKVVISPELENSCKGTDGVEVKSEIIKAVAISNPIVPKSDNKASPKFTKKVVKLSSNLDKLSSNETKVEKSTKIELKIDNSSKIELKIETSSKPKSDKSDVTLEKISKSVELDINKLSSKDVICEGSKIKESVKLVAVVTDVPETFHKVKSKKIDAKAVVIEKESASCKGLESTSSEKTFKVSENIKQSNSQVINEVKDKGKVQSLIETIEESPKPSSEIISKGKCKSQDTDQDILKSKSKEQLPGTPKKNVRSKKIQSDETIKKTSKCKKADENVSTEKEIKTKATKNTKGQSSKKVIKKNDSSSDEETVFKMNEIIKKLPVVKKNDNTSDDDAPLKMKGDADLPKTISKGKKVVALKKEPCKEEDDSCSATSEVSEPPKKVVRVRKNMKSTRESIANQRLKQFWSGPKRHRVASLNALAKVHCLYENESRTALELGLLKTVVVKDRSPSPEVSTRQLRTSPGRRGVGKHWDMHDSTSSSSESEDDNVSVYHNPRRRTVVNKTIKTEPKKKVAQPRSKSDDSKTKDRNNSPVAKKPVEEKVKPVVKRRRNRTDVVMDLKDMVVRKRMASLNASAILAASYERRSPKYGRNSSSSDSSSNSSSDYDDSSSSPATKKSGSTSQSCSSKNGEVIEVKATPNKKVVIVNREDTDVTITGVYVNSTTRSMHHEGFCSIAGMQYRISSTSHTQTAATAVATETLLHPTDAPAKSYTPLSALSNMKPPGSVRVNPNATTQPQISPLDGIRPGCSSAFSAPPVGYVVPGGPSSVQSVSDQCEGQGYYQPAGPLISTSQQHPHTHQHPPLAPLATIKSSSPSRLSSISNPSNDTDNDVIITSDTMSPLPPPSGPGSGGTAYRFPPTPGASGEYPPRQIVHCPPPYPCSSGSQYYPPAHAPPHAPPPYQEMCYTSAYPPATHFVYGNSQKVYSTGHPPAFRRYLAPFYPADAEIYPPSGSQNSQLVSAGPSVPALVEPYPGPPYYPGYSPGAPPCYSHSAPPRNLAYIDTAYQSCPCPMQSCPKNVHTGPLIGKNSIKGPLTNNLQPITAATSANEMNKDNISVDNNITFKNETTTPEPAPAINVNVNTNSPKKELVEGGIGDTDTKSVEILKQNIYTTSTNCVMEGCGINIQQLPPAALALPMEPLLGPPSPARGSAGMGPTPSPSGAVYNNGLVAAKPEEDNKHTSKRADLPEKRKARIGKNMVRNSIANGLLMNSEKGTSILLMEHHTKENYELGNLNKVEEVKKEQEDDVVLVDDKNSEPINLSMDNTKLNKTNDNGEPTLPMKRKASTDEITDDLEVTIPEKKRKANAEESVSPNSSYKNLIKKSSKPIVLNNGQQHLSLIKTSFTTPKISLKGKKKPVKRKLVKSDKVKKVVSENVKSCDNNKKDINLACVEKISNKNNVDETIEFVINNYCDEVENKRTEKEVIKKQENTLKVSKPAEIKEKVSNKINKTKEKLLKVAEVKNDHTEQTEIIAPVTNNTINNNDHSTINNNEILQSIIHEEPCSIIKQKIKARLGCGKAGTSKKKVRIVEPARELIISPKKPLTVPKWCNNWVWEGRGYQAKVFLNSDLPSVMRTCYSAMRHTQGDIIRPKDCVLLKPTQKKELPFVAKVAALWENPEDGEMMMSLLWYYRPEHTEQGRTPIDEADEVFASRHKDSNSVACIEDRCYVLTFNEYCRYRKRLRAFEQNIECKNTLVPSAEKCSRRSDILVPLNTSQELILFCRKVYDFRQKRLVKNPS